MKNSLLFLVFLLANLFVNAQFSHYRYHTKLQKPTSLWHEVRLDASILPAVKHDYADVRLFRVFGKDTAEVPFVFKELPDSILVKELMQREMRVVHNEESKQTVIEVDLYGMIPLCSLQVLVKDTLDFRREVRFAFPEGEDDELKLMPDEITWEQFYLSSEDENKFSFERRWVNKVRIVIDNKDNAPLHIAEVKCFYESPVLLGRFEKFGDFYLCFDNREANAPEYDLAYFGDKIPKEAKQLTYTFDEKIKAEEKKENKTMQWLWFVLGGVLLLIFLFSLKMLRSKG